MNATPPSETFESPRALDASSVVYRAVDYDRADVLALMARYVKQLNDDDPTMHFSGDRPSLPPDQKTASDAVPDDFVPPNGLFIGAFADDVLVGGGGVRFYTDGAGAHVGEIKRMFVDPVARGLGVGRRILEIAEDAAVTFGCRVARLDTRSSLTTARALYTSTGYFEIERYNDNEFAQHFYEKPLPLSEDALRRFGHFQGIRAEDQPAGPVNLQRVVKLDGPFNFRDIGGYVGTDGKEVRSGIVFRSDKLDLLSDSDLAELKRRAIADVYDFRLDIERDRQPSRFGLGWDPTVHVLSTSDTTEADSSMVDILNDVFAGRRPIPPASFWEESYVTLLDKARPMFVALVGGLACSGTPAVYHCSGGKDRTGIATALILRLLGVEDEVIVEDFLLTNLLRTASRLAVLRRALEANGSDTSSLAPIAGVTRSGIISALSCLDSVYGGAESYLVAGGLSTDDITQLRLRLLE